MGEGDSKRVWVSIEMDAATSSVFKDQISPFISLSSAADRWAYSVAEGSLFPKCL